MWSEKLANGKIKYVERYKDPLTETYKKVSVTLTSDSSRAQKKAQRMLDDKIKEKLVAFESNIQKKTFEEVAMEWLEDYKKKVKGSTYSVRSYMLDRLLEEYLGDGRNFIISNIKENFIQEKIDDMIFNKKWSVSYTNGMLAVISMVFKFALKKKYVSSLDAVAHIKVTRPRKTVAELEANRIPKFLEKDQLKYVLEYIYSVNQEYGTIFDIQAYTGMRVSEILALTESDVRPGFIAVRSTLDNYYRSPTKGQRTTPKTTKAFREFEISNRIQRILDERIALNRLLPQNEEKFIFLTEKGNPHKTVSLTNFLNYHSKKLDIGIDVKSHVFRHTHISMLAAEGVPLHVIMDRVGHEDEGTTKKIYLHVTKTSKEKLVSVLEKL